MRINLLQFLLIVETMELNIPIAVTLKEIKIPLHQKEIEFVVSLEDGIVPSRVNNG